MMFFRYIPIRLHLFGFRGLFAPVRKTRLFPKLGSDAGGALPSVRG